MEDRDLSIMLLKNIHVFHSIVKVIVSERNESRILTERQFFALKKMAEIDKMELKNLSKVLHVSTSSLCILLNKLVEQGYVYREEDKKDRRNTFYGITEKGSEVLEIEKADILKIINKKIELIDEDKREDLYKALDLVFDTLIGTLNN
ncbi:MarR family winged helix-turn-helix transcriptional regulator [Peptacetobacter hiranonis]|uniref:Transcriptional regulator, MarR family n=1 Tax=Peptacetobacter hiranonis (strain DSM 13275 / JCM 10541 / KCTC 15199 / TO-931) TaxID=500633 RepID=B6FZA9_PEPHT|nr:winged helix DNA-binding protein [Peptacetobacter hiranonis]EEA85112.1 transcriptional regulator, MarR family [Peptacetobacter hiranonis DSM 13275]QEK21007.1 HTH-type transcriptional regulator Hpr [Peptacetobacter hiranonis]